MPYSLSGRAPVSKTGWRRFGPCIRRHRRGQCVPEDAAKANPWAFGEDGGVGRVDTGAAHGTPPTNDTDGVEAAGAGQGEGNLIVKIHIHEKAAAPGSVPQGCGLFCGQKQTAAPEKKWAVCFPILWIVQVTPRCMRCPWSRSWKQNTLRGCAGR